MRRTMTCPKCGDALGVEHHSPNQRVLICPATLTCGWAQTQLLADDGLWRSAADVAKEKGRGAAARNAGAVWREQALEAAHDLALAHGHLTAADLRRHMEGLGIGEPPSPGAYGHVLPTAARRGWLEDTGRVMKSPWPGANARKVTVWRSLVYAG